MIEGGAASVMQAASINEGRWAHTMAGDHEYEQCIKVFFFLLFYATWDASFLFHFYYLIMDLMLNGDFLFYHFTYFFRLP
jgi:hypothetical protein